MNVTPWTHYNPVRVLFQPGALGEIAENVESTRIALVTTPGFVRRGTVNLVEKALGSRLVDVVDDVNANPDVEAVQTQSVRLRNSRPELLIALGGGSTIDTAKGLARLLTQPEDTSLLALLRGDISAAAALALPVVAVPTTAGTGAEVTPFGTIWDHAGAKKYSIVSGDLYPRMAILDPELTLGMPPEVTVSSGLDAVSHALESAWNRNATPVTLGLATSSLRLSLNSLATASENPGDIAARSAMMQASTLAGLAISQSRTALAHAISYPLTTRFDLPHGLACSFTLPALLAFNAESDDGRLAALASSVGYDDIESLVRGLSRLFERLNLGAYITRYLPDQSSIVALADQMFAPGRAENNLRDPSEQQVRDLLTTSLEALGL